MYGVEVVNAEDESDNEEFARFSDQLLDSDGSQQSLDSHFAIFAHMEKDGRRMESAHFLEALTPEDMERWVFHLNLICLDRASKLNDNERAMKILLNEAASGNTEPPVSLCFSKTISAPLTSLSSDELRAEAVELFKCTLATMPFRYTNSLRDSRLHLLEHGD